MAHEAPVLQPDTPARRNLVRWMRAGSLQERGQTAIARALGLKQQSVRQWIVRISRPGTEHRQALQVLTKGEVVAPDWETRAERRQRERLLKRLASASP